MIIGIDLDETIIYHVVQPEEQAARNLGIKEYSECNDWYFSNLTKRHKTEIMRLFNDPYYMGLKCNCPIKGSIDKLSEWSLYHKIIIITARNKSVRKATKYMVEKFFPSVNDLIFVDIEHSKKEAMIESQIDLWVDDNPKGVQTSCELGIETYLIYNDQTKRYISREIIKVLPVKCIESIADVKLKGEI